MKLQFRTGFRSQMITKLDLFGHICDSIYRLKYFQVLLICFVHQNSVYFLSCENENGPREFILGAPSASVQCPPGMRVD